VLLISDNPTVRKDLNAALSVSSIGRFEVKYARTLADALESLNITPIAAILLDMFLPDSQGIETFERLFAAVPDVPILIAGDIAHEDDALQTIDRGAQDYLLLEDLNCYAASRAVRTAIKRNAIANSHFIERERAQITLNSIGDAVLSTDVAGNITYLNLVAETMTGWSRDEANGQPLVEVFHIIDGLSRAIARNPMLMAIQQDKTVGLTENCMLIRRDGTEFAIEDSAAPIHDRRGHIVGAVIVFHDVSKARALSSQLKYAAHHDVLTDLPNRLLLMDRITQAIVSARRNRTALAVIFMDLDHFKNINDSLGHAVGDKILRSVSARLVANVRGSDTVSRQGGDEFIILLSEIAHPEDAAISAAKLLGAVSAPITIDSNYLCTNCSIGISIYPSDGTDAETLIQNADTAMYHAKETGRNAFHFFESGMTARAVERQLIESCLSRAIERNEFVLYYQPIVDLKTEQIAGMEALIRWQHPERGLVFPDEFIRFAEDSGLIVKIGKWVLGEACRQAVEWRRMDLPDLIVAVNVSAVEFMENGFVQGVRECLAESGLESRFLKLELTEGVLMKDVAKTDGILHELNAMGIELGVDDFGTGYSSLSYLRKFPIAVVKIDRSFVQQITEDGGNTSIVSAIIGLGQSLGHIVIAEGIETEAQKEYLQSRDCAMGQGYLFGRPQPADATKLLLEAAFACQ
jgi:diguanylate cyclase (GGDEF)-like protein/PAS domain S-box-containing protein